MLVAVRKIILFFARSGSSELEEIVLEGKKGSDELIDRWLKLYVGLRSLRRIVADNVLTTGLSLDKSSLSCV